MTELQQLKRLKSKIKILKKAIREPTLYSENNNRILALQMLNLEKLRVKHRKLYMKIHSKKYYKNHSKTVIKAVTKYHSTTKGKKSRKRYEESRRAVTNQ